MALSGLSAEEVARRSRHKTAHVLDLFADPNPNPSLRLYLDLANGAGAQLEGVRGNTPGAVVAHLAALARDNGITVSALARSSGVSRPQLSTLFNDPDPNPTLATLDRLVTALGAESQFGLVRAVDEADAEEDEVEEDEVEEDEAEEDEAEEDEAEEDEAEEDEAEEDEAEEDEDEEDEAEEDEAEEDEDDAEGDEAEEEDDSEAVVETLQRQNTQLQQRVRTNEAELAQLKKDERWRGFKRAAGIVTSGLAGAALAVAVLKRSKK
jgi:transcriptional regulator with XRE-family HTH domain